MVKPKLFVLFINGKKSNYTSTIKKELELDLKGLLEHEDNKNWIKNKTFEIKEEERYED